MKKTTNYPFSKQNDRLTFVQGDTNASTVRYCAHMWMRFCTEYWKETNPVRSQGYKQQLPFAYHDVDNTHHIVFIGEKVVGWIRISPKNHVLQDVWIRPKYRGFGIATRVYHNAIQAGLGLNLSFERLSTLDKVEYFNKLGYNSAMYYPGATDGKGDLLLIYPTNHNVYEHDDKPMFTYDARAQELSMVGLKKLKDLSKKITIRSTQRNKSILEVYNNLVSGRQAVLNAKNGKDFTIGWNHA